MSGFQLISELECNENESDFNVNKWVTNCFDKLNDDFNTPMLIAELFECVKFLNNVKIKSKNLNIGDRETIEKIFNTILFEIFKLRPSRKSVLLSSLHKKCRTQFIEGSDTK